MTTGPKLHWLPALREKSGRVAISARPRGGDWLSDEVAGWKRSGIDVVVSLLTPSEEADLDLMLESKECRMADLDFFALPVPDRGTPENETSIPETVGELISRLNDGESVAIHCRQGIGRSGLLAAAILMAMGASADEAANTVSEARGLKTPETPGQMEWLRQFQPLTSSPTGPQ